MEDRRPTREVVHLIDVDEDSPNPGETVLALTQGGVLIKTIWTKDSSKTLKAWMPHPKIPKSVKEKLHEMYMNGGWKLNGTRPEQTGNE